VEEYMKIIQLLRLLRAIITEKEIRSISYSWGKTARRCERIVWSLVQQGTLSNMAN